MNTKEAQRSQRMSYGDLCENHCVLCGFHLKKDQLQQQKHSLFRKY